ncbi:YdcF family protein [Patescibacteria group bacterium]
MKWIITVVIILVVLIWGVVGIGFYLSPQNKLAKVDAIVVISGGETKARTHEGADLYFRKYSDNIIFSGAAEDQDESGVSNAQTMADIATELGVNKDDMILEETSDTTYQNAQEVEKILEENNWNSIILVTSPYHQKRAYFSFKKALGEKFAIINRSATDSTWRKNGWWKTKQGWYLSLNEIQKIIYLYATGNYD